MAKHFSYDGDKHNCSNCYYGVIKLRPWKEDPKEDEAYFECDEKHDDLAANANDEMQCPFFKPQEYTSYESLEEMWEELGIDKEEIAKLKEDLKDEEEREISEEDYQIKHLKCAINPDNDKSTLKEIEQ